jgi:large subunit ribosomal protein L21
MFAIVTIAGQQFKVEKDKFLYVNRLPQEQGAAVTFDQVLLVADGDSTTVGAPTVKGAKVNGTILEHLQGDKVIVFKMKRRKDYRKKNGHRQQLTKVRIEGITA